MGRGACRARTGRRGHYANAARAGRSARHGGKGASRILALQAEAYGRAGQVEEGLNALEEALTSRQDGERYWEADLYRLKGELLLAQEGSRLQAVGFREKTEEAEECFLKAIEIARELQAKSWSCVPPRA